MSLDQPTDVVELREVLKQVLCQCPHQDDQDPDCALCDFKRLSPGEREVWMDGLSDDEVIMHSRRHHRCFWGKLGDR
jgi:hypothetical protein